MVRADARRNRDRLVAVAEEVVAEQGADASLEEIARRAGVGSATLHRHFQGRQGLLEEVFRERVTALCASADALADEPPADALAGWLAAVVTHATTNRGLGTVLVEATTALAESSHARITAAGERLLTRAQEAGAADPDVTISDVLPLVNAISLAAGHDADRAARLLSITLNGLLH